MGVFPYVLNIQYFKNIATVYDSPLFHNYPLLISQLSFEHLLTLGTVLVVRIQQQGTYVWKLRFHKQVVLKKKEKRKKEKVIAGRSWAKNF